MDDTAEHRSSKRPKLSKTVLATIERKRQNAILLRDSRLEHKTMKPVANKLPDDAQVGIHSETKIKEQEHKEDLFDDRIRCSQCNVNCNASYLYVNFSELMCDECREKDKDSYNMISKTDAKNQYVLKDCDFDYREPVLRYVRTANPHRRGGEMKLYLECQVYERACVVHGGEAGIERAIAEAQQRKESFAQRKLEKRLRGLRDKKERKPKAVHVHEFEEEKCVNEEEDTYSRKCAQCGYVEIYEKL